MSIKLSFSAAQRYLLSPASYFLHYIERLRPVEVSSPLFFGSAIDNALNHLLEVKKAKGDAKLALTQAKQIFHDSLVSGDVNGVKTDLRLQGVVKFSKADLDESLLSEIEIPKGHSRSWYSLYEKGLILIDSYNEQVLPKIEEVILVQHQINIKNEDGDVFTGVVDLVAKLTDGKTYVIDNKTSSIKYADDSVDTSQQLATYFDALQHDYKLDGCAYIVIPKNIRKLKEPKCEIVWKFGESKEELIQKTYTEYDQVLCGIKAGKFDCSRQCLKTPWGCQYAAYCRSNGNDTTGLVKVEKSGK